MKICFLANAASIHTQRWVNFFAQRGHDVYLITEVPIDVSFYPNVVIYRFEEESPLKKYYKRFFSISKLIRAINPDILHSHWVTGWGFWGALSGYHPHVATAWGSDIKIFPQKSIFLKWKAMFVLRMADYITCDANHMVNSIEELGAIRDKIKIIHFGTDMEQFNPNRKDAEIKRALKIDIDSQLVISVRNLSPIYDVETFIKSIPHVLKEVPQAKFIIVGEGVQRQYLEELSASLRIVGSVRFIGGIQTTDMARYLASSDVYVSTAISDGGLSASTAEAMACGLPVIITDVGDNRQWIKDGEQGFIIPVSDYKLLGEKIIELLLNPHLRKRFGEINREIIKEKNNYHNEMEKVEDMYSMLAQKYSTRRNQ